MKPRHRPKPPSSPPPPAPAERLQKLLAAAGLGSRREIEGWIAAGRVSVNGRIARLGDKASAGDRIGLDGRGIALEKGPRPPRVLIYHKPVGELVTRSDPGGRPTVFAGLPRLEAGKWVSVGRLDLNSSGLLLFTDSGELANDLMHPRGELEREYQVRVFHGLSPDEIRRALGGIPLEDGLAAFERIEPGRGEGANRWYRVVLREGRKREVRRMFEALGRQVSRLARVRFGPVELPPSLAPGRWSELPKEAVERLLRIVRGDKSC